MHCKNCPHKSYKGNENTPLGRGYTAYGEEGKCRKGLDGNMYISTGKKWVKKGKNKRTKRGFGGDYNPDFMSTRYDDMQRDQKRKDNYRNEILKKDPDADESTIREYIRGKEQSRKDSQKSYKLSGESCDYLVSREIEKGLQLDNTTYDSDLVDLLDNVQCSSKNRGRLINMLSIKYRDYPEEQKIKNSRRLINNYMEEIN